MHSCHKIKMKIQVVKESWIQGEMCYSFFLMQIPTYYNWNDCNMRFIWGFLFFFLAKNPPPACLEAPQVMYLPPLQFCIKLYDIYLPENRLHMCVNLETRLARAPLLVLQFDCFLMGRGGVSNVKPEASNMFYTLVVDGDNRTYLLTNDTRISNRSDESSQYIINSTESLNSYVAT